MVRLPKPWLGSDVRGTVAMGIGAVLLNSSSCIGCAVPIWCGSRSGPFGPQALTLSITSSLETAYISKQQVTKKGSCLSTL